jgi:uncharacterized protein YggT (Ycf19 family)
MQRAAPTHAEGRAEVETAEVTQAEPTAAGVAAPIPGEPVPAATPLTRQIETMGATTTVRRRSVLAEPGYRAVQMIWLLLTAAEAFVALRVIFRAVRANPDAGFVRFVDFVGGWLTAPFRPIVADSRVSGGGMLEIGSLIAMAVFLVAALLLVRLVRILTAPRVPAEPASV